MPQKRDLAANPVLKLPQLLAVIPGSRGAGRGHPGKEPIELGAAGRR